MEIHNYLVEFLKKKTKKKLLYIYMYPIFDALPRCNSWGTKPH